jgi:hypothetical protein
MGRALSANGKKRNAYRLLTRSPERNPTIGRTKM